MDPPFLPVLSWLERVAQSGRSALSIWSVLQIEEVSVVAVQREQLRVGAGFDQLPIPQHENTVESFDRSEVMRDDDDGSVPIDLVKSIADQLG